jgi:hypothetical protein
MSLPLTEVLSNLLQAQWNNAATGLQVTDVFWSHTVYQAVDQLGAITQRVIISVYNPPAPAENKVQSREFAVLDEVVIVDILMKLANYPDLETALQTREAIIQWLVQTVLAQQFNASGQKLIQLQKMLVKAESPSLLRCAWQVKGTSFIVNTSLR